MKYFFSIFIFSFLIVYIAISRPWRVEQIPNGSKNSCSNCHNSPNGGDARNFFGQEVENNFLDNSGNVIWGFELANIDSDGDGFTNGEELQDPEGKWIFGDPEPGNPDLVTSPWDATSHPNTTSVNDIARNDGFIFNSIYPNPVKENSSFSFSLSKPGFIKFELFNSAGMLMVTLGNEYLSTGQHTKVLNSDMVKNSGIYLLRISSIGLNYFEKILISK